MTGPYDVLADAYAALLELTERVYLPDQELPEDEAPLIRLDLIDWVDRARYGSASTVTRIQVSVWANSLDAAIGLHQQARSKLLALRCRPDGGGQLRDPETSQFGWRADYRR
ncbi:MAG: hypothetical protein Q4C89_09345 [Deinococcus sp.]|uniref:hypothetical protein n=1 Tax=Deinococcus sp. TaxID=47478 RepID=UPI0026DD2B0F|nr:hypothetical protein [Deinococcus sp.]MDO4246215.1 hypothetical protein [Deinococcus sp.]